MQPWEAVFCILVSLTFLILDGYGEQCKGLDLWPNLEKLCLAEIMGSLLGYIQPREPQTPAQDHQG